MGGFNSRSMPLPEKFPIPDNEGVCKQLADLGIVLDIPADYNYECNQLDVNYTLPDEWKMVKLSTDPSDPAYVVIDENGDQRVKIFGHWSHASIDKEDIYNYLNVQII